MHREPPAPTPDPAKSSALIICIEARNQFVYFTHRDSTSSNNVAEGEGRRGTRRACLSSIEAFCFTLHASSPELQKLCVRLTKQLLFRLHVSSPSQPLAPSLAQPACLTRLVDPINELSWKSDAAGYVGGQRRRNPFINGLSK